jgi:outer membrane protein
MKKFFRSGGLLVFLFLFALAANAQNFRYMNSAAVLASMSEIKQANATLEVTQKQYQEKGKKMVEDLQAKYQEVQRKVQEGSLSPKQQEEEATKLRAQEEEIGKFEQDVAKKLQDKRAELLNPLLDRVNQAIKDVATENGFQFIFDASPGAGILLYADEKMDVTQLVMTKLGIQAETSNN